MDWLQAVVLGVLQGLTEFLPISSSAHLRIFPELFGWGDPGAAFTAVTQIGTETAVILYFAKDIWRIIRAWFRSLGAGREALRTPVAASVEAGVAGDPDDVPVPRRERRGGHRRKRMRDSVDARMGWFVIIGTIPIGVLGYLGKDIIENDFRSLWIIGTTLVVLGVILGVADRVGRKERTVADLTFRDAVLIGLAQALALVPGVSRSGASISMGLFLGLDRKTAARFAFLLAIPAVMGAGIYEWPSAMSEGSGYSGAQTVVATIVAFFVGYGVIAWLMKWLESRSYSPFVTYRITLGGLVLVLLATGNLAA